MKRFKTHAIFAVSVFLAGCSQDYRDIGPYRVLDVTDGFFGALCQTRQEFYFLQPERGTEPTYLGTCGSPGFITEQVGFPGDPSCFSVAEGGASIVYLHRPEICGAGAEARAKPAGVYTHSAIEGDRLAYGARQVSQVWGGEAVSSGAIRVTWLATTPSRAGAQCGQSLVIYSDGREEVEGRADPDSPLCVE
jgi:hypothetical protein